LNLHLHSDRRDVGRLLVVCTLCIETVVCRGRMQVVLNYAWRPSWWWLTASMQMQAQLAYDHRHDSLHTDVSITTIRSSLRQPVHRCKQDNQ
jgi:hypothetical protein